MFVGEMLPMLAHVSYPYGTVDTPKGVYCTVWGNGYTGVRLKAFVPLMSVASPLRFDPEKITIVPGFIGTHQFFSRPQKCLLVSLLPTSSPVFRV